MFDVCIDIHGVEHLKNSKWTSDYCLDCSCKENGLKCCSRVAVPVDYDKIRCHSIFHKDNCTYTVEYRKDPGKPCPVSHWKL
ncbi:Beta-microseminoprotein [Heterocephalus glaber]|uniref:Beta-microseminoprotein n=1 Tax=Heterocephalus glaber TaxID=10181 RepID=G5BHV6_HETGA|nr:Beta-microseminoprotein [Heterocephalus glaber]